MSKPSRYKITEFKDGFTITVDDRYDRRPTTMQIAPNGLGFVVSTQYKVVNHWNNTVALADKELSRTFGIPHLYDIVGKLSSNLMMGWQSPKGKNQGHDAIVLWD